MAYNFINLLAKYKYFYFEAKINLLMPLNSNYYKPKLIKRNLDIYKLIARENLLVLYSKISRMRKVLLLTMQYCKYINKIR